MKVRELLAKMANEDPEADVYIVTMGGQLSYNYKEAVDLVVSHANPKGGVALVIVEDF